MKVGRPVVAAAVDAGAVYLDSTGEPRSSARYLRNSARAPNGLVRYC